MRALFTATLILALVSCHKDNVEPEAQQPAVNNGNNTTSSTWNPFVVEHSFYVDYYIACTGCNKADIIDTIFYRNITTGDSTLIVVDDQLIQYFPDNNMPTYPDSAFFIGTNENAYAKIGLQNTSIGDSIHVYVKFSGVGSMWGCGIYQNDLPNAASWSYINNVGPGLRIANGFRVE